MVRMPILPLTDDQKQALIEISRRAPEILIHRARLILAYAAGKPTLQAAAEAGISRGRARFWKRQFYARGMEIFKPDSSFDDQGERPSGFSSAPHAEEKNGSVTGDGSDKQIHPQDEIPFPEPRSVIGIMPDDSLAEAGRKVWQFHFALMLSHEQGTIRGQDAEELHDMRVATRRMRTAFDVFAPAFDPKTMKHYLKSLRTAGRVLGEVRDLDVIYQHASNYQGDEKDGNHPGLDPLLAAWSKIIDKKRQKMVQHLQSDEYQKFKLDFNLFLHNTQTISHDYGMGGASSHLRDVVPVLVYGRYAAVKAYENILATASVEQLHALRIEFKKFRYVLEYFREILGDHIGHAITELKQLQDHLGDLHDTDVACQLVLKFLERWAEDQLTAPIAERKNPEPIVTYLAFLHSERYRLMSSFPELWRKFNRAEFRQAIAQAISLL